MRAFIRDRGVARVDEICEALRVSPATTRRDLEHLEKAGHLRRVHGGAVSVESRTEEPLFDDKTALFSSEKRAIAKAALALVQPGDSIFLDGGSTVLELARLLRDRTNLTVVTNSLRAASELSGQGPRVIVIGGELRRLSQTLVGPLTRHLLGDLRVDRAFMGTIGLTATEGLTTTDTNEAFTKTEVIRRATEVVVLADHAKIGKVSFVNAGRLDDIDVLVTDRKADKAFLKEARAHGVRVVTAEG
ncbi:MAG TPA: DeoR/GlpR family DNA-binding transcription regulator [Kiritimatiellia bacterium]|nr:DeoR/GlpR family DNA-binding transcription regulator [Kiritimatiellia bacterium]